MSCLISVEADVIISTLSEMVGQSYVQTRFLTDEETWPPYQPKNFTPLALLYHYDRYHSKQEAVLMAHLIQKGGIDEIPSSASFQLVPKQHSKLDNYDPLQEVLYSSKVTKELREILAPLEQSKDPQFILIEGAPGIGKSILLKEIAYRWGMKELLIKFKLVLLVSLRDPAVQMVKSTGDLLQFIFSGTRRAIELAAACRDYLLKIAGKDILFLFDGFDEFPTELQKTSLITDILMRRVLPCCCLVVSSRSHTVARLTYLSTLRIEVLGFTNIERHHFIQQALKETPQGIMELTQYLEDHITISNLCAVPFNMTVLVCLYKEGITLPKNSTELYNHFICFTICRHLAKHCCTLYNTITSLNDVPSPYDRIIHQLSRLSLKALTENRRVYTFNEIRVVCPDIIAIPGAINGFGLLQAMEYIDFNEHGITMAFTFINIAIQEFLAAHHIANLPPNKELEMLKATFWNDRFFNMILIYITITKGQQPSFKQFIKASFKQRLIGFLTGAKVTNRFINNEVKCFRLFRCFFELGDETFCRSIENAKVFNSNTITINSSSRFEDTTLSPSDGECLTCFLTYSSHKVWERVNLHHCHIRDDGIQTLHHGLSSCDVNITRLELPFNNLTESSSSAIIDITRSCKVKKLLIGHNDINICENDRLYSIISDQCSKLEMLNIRNTKLSPMGAIKLFAALSESKKLRWLDVGYNSCITEEVCDAIVVALKQNTSLVELRMDGNPISGEYAQCIVSAIQHNHTLEWLRLSCTDIKGSIKLLVNETNTKRESRGCKVKLRVWI